jgi:serine/threonine protein kinase
MNDPPQDSTVGEKAGAAASNKAISTCPKCGTKIPASLPSERCPVCQLQGALDPEVASGLTDADKPAASSPQIFDHYELLTGDDGTPIELGRGAMGVTYRAFDSNLRCPVALKVINARYLNDESARLRFVREARAAARLRHPNVASVFHLGKKNGDYFYAMEFVEGEALDQVIKSRGPMPVPLALDIVDQVAAALQAAHQEQIVHRDIKPGNLMLRFGEGGSVNVKVIDFGLAKAASSAQSDPALSTPGTFTGTALFASPEQCAGSEVDIRSDIYSLGVTLWEMLTGKVPFTGTTVQVMGQHLHAPLPLERLKNIPEPAVVLLKHMLEKDPARRPQNPSELRAEIRAVSQALVSQRGTKAVVGRKGGWRVARWLGIGVALLAVVSGIGFYFLVPKSRSALATTKSIAVLPFDNLSDSKQNEYFSLFCSMQVRDWPAVIRTIEAKGEKENPTSLLRLALALRGTNRPEEARQTAERVTALAQQKLPTAKSPRWMRFDLAVGNRLLERKDAAYQTLHELLANGGFPDPVLGRADPGLEVFKPDLEIQNTLADLDRKSAAIRTRILDIEKSF